MSRSDKWQTILSSYIRKEVKNGQKPSVRMAVVTSLTPLTIMYNNVKFSADRDYIYINNLLLDENINLDVDGAMAGIQNIKGMNPPPLISPTTTNPDYTATIEGTIPDFIKSFYNYFKAWHDRFILHVGDFVAIQKIGENKIIILSKLEEAVVKDEQVSIYS